MAEDELINQIFVQRYEEKSGLAFPVFRQLSLADATAIRARLRERLGLPLDSSDLAVYRMIRVASERLPLDASMNEIELEQVLRTLGAALHEDVFLENNWSEHTFEMRLTDASLAFHALWQPAAIDLCILDSELEWNFEMDHDGNGWFLKL